MTGALQYVPEGGRTPHPEVPSSAPGNSCQGPVSAPYSASAAAAALLPGPLDAGSASDCLGAADTGAWPPPDDGAAFAAAGVAAAAAAAADAAFQVCTVGSAVCRQALDVCIEQLAAYVAAADPEGAGVADSAAAAIAHAAVAVVARAAGNEGGWGRELAGSGEAPAGKLPEKLPGQQVCLLEAVAECFGAFGLMPLWLAVQQQLCPDDCHLPQVVPIGRCHKCSV